MTNELRDLLHNAQWAIELLSKQARPYNHEYTCVVRLTQAIGAVERGFAVHDGGSVECPHCHWGFAPSVIQQHISEKHA